MIQDKIYDVKEDEKYLNTLNKRRSRKNYINKLLVIPLVIAISVYIVIIVLPILTMINYSGVHNIVSTLYVKENISSVLLTLETSTIALILTFIFGTCMAFYLRFVKNKALAKVLSILIELPIVLPPAAVGIALLLTFGSNGIIGRMLDSYGISLVFTPAAVIIAQFFVSSAFYVKVLSNSINDVPKEIFEATYVLGAGKIETIYKIIIPMLKRAIISGLILSYIRSIGEFGATLMFAGNVLNKTRTIPLQIYTYMQTDIKMATSFAAILYLLSFLLLFFVRVFLRDDGDML
jgi:molybdate transport system permease protein